MSKTYSDSEIKAKLKEIRCKDINASPEFHNTIEETLASLPVNNKAKVSIGKKSIMAAAIIVLCIVAIGVINPAFAENIPFVGTVFKQLSSKNSENITNEKYAVGIGQTQKDRGLAIRIDEAVFDGSRLVVGFTVKSDKPFKNISGIPFIVGDIEVEFDGETMRSAALQSDGKYTDEYTYVGVTKWDLGSEAATTAAQAEVFLTFNKLNFNGESLVGNWKYRFTIDTSKTSQDVKVIKSDFVYKNEIGELKILKCTISPLALSIFYEAPQDPVIHGREYTGEASYLQAAYWDVRDNKDNKLKVEADRCRNGEEMNKPNKNNEYPPMQGVIKFKVLNPDTEYITIKTSKFETKIPLK